MKRIYLVKQFAKEKTWGRLRENNERIGEIIKFEVNDTQSNNIVIDGKLMSLYEIFNSNLCREFYGDKYVDKKVFPFMIKFIDSSKKLSLQVHPKEKTETWLFLKNNAQVLIGLKEKIDISKISTEEILKKSLILDVDKYNFLEVAPGTIHSIFEDNLICEVQDNYDQTYRYYDWHGRNLSKKKFIETAIFDKIDLKKILKTKLSFYSSKNFSMKFLKINNSTNIKTYKDCKVVLVLDGHCIIEEENEKQLLETYSTVLIIPNSNVKIIGNCDLLVVY